VSSSRFLHLGMWLGAFWMGCVSRPLTEATHLSEHPVGIVLRAPSHVRERAVSVEATKAGFVVTVADSRLQRFRESASVECSRTSRFPSGSTPRRRTVAGRLVAFDVSVGNCGSGGNEYYFRATMDVEQGVLVYEQAQCSEGPFAPEFSLAWMLIEGTSASRCEGLK
jgi:hypothetical protein